MCSEDSSPIDPVGALRAAVDAVTGLDVTGLPGDGCLELARELSVALARLTGVRLAALSAVQASGAWGLDGSRSMPWALARREDAAIGPLRAEITFAQRLSGDLPLTAAALRRGEVSLGQGQAAGPVGADQQRPPRRADRPEVRGGVPAGQGAGH